MRDTSQLKQYLLQWSLRAPQRIAQTHTSTVYLVQREGLPLILKLLNALGIRDEQRGAVALSHYWGRGAARLLDAAPDAHLLEYLPGDDLLALVEAGHDDAAASVIATVVQALHAVKAKTPPDGLHPLRHRFRSLFRLVETDANATLVHGARIAEKLLADSREPVVLHGDIHHWNIRHSTRGWLAIDPKGLYGERTYDVANALINPFGMPHIVNDMARLLRHAQIYATALDVTQARVLEFTFAHACLSVTWSMEDGEDYAHTLAVARLLETCVSNS